MNDLDQMLIGLEGEDASAILTLDEGDEGEMTVVVMVDTLKGEAVTMNIGLSSDVMAATLRVYRGGDFCGEERLDVSR